jgi:hypothetical protein
MLCNAVNGWRVSKKKLKIYMTLSRKNINAMIDRATGLKK